MKRGSLIALGLSAGVVALTLSTRAKTPPRLVPPPQPPSPPPPTPPGPRVERAYVERQTGLRDQPAEGSGVVSILAVGTPVDVEQAASPGWVFASVVRPGLPPLEGYLKVADLTFTAPAKQLTQSGQLFDASLRPIDVVRPQPPAPPLYEPYRPGRIITNVPDPTRFLTGESNGEELVRVLDTVAGPFKAMADYYARTWYPAKIGTSRPDISPRLTNVSQYRSFWDQAAIVVNTLRIKPTSSDDELRAAFRQSLTTRSVPGFSRHHWGTEIDVVAADSSAWRRGGYLSPLWPFVHEEAPKFGFYTPFREGFFPEPTKAHYNDEPWHLSYFPEARGLRERWLSEVDVPSLLIRVATALSPGLGISRDRIAAVLVTLDLPSYQENVARPPMEART